MDLSEIFKEHLNGTSLNKLSQKYNIKRWLLTKEFKNAGFNLVSKNDIYRQKLQSIIELYKNKISIRTISKELNIPITQIWRLLKENEVPTNKLYEYDSYKKNNIDEYFEKIDSPNKAYFLGFLYADGNVHSKLNHVTLKLKHSDVSILNDIKRVFNIKTRIYISKSKKDNVEDQVVLKIVNWRVRKNFIKHGVIPRKTWKLKFPFWLDKELRSHFIRGYFDGDGCIYQETKNRNVTISICGTEQMCSDIRFILEDVLGIRSVVSPDRKIFRIRIRRYSDIVRFCEWMYKDAELFLPRKYEKFQQIKRLK